MGAIEIFLVVMSCSASTLFCDNRSEARSYADMDQCHAAREEVVESGPEAGEEERLTLAKCQYVMTGPSPDEVPDPRARPLW